MLANPTPTVLNAIDDDSAKNPMNGKTMIAKIKQIIKLWIYLQEALNWF